MIWEDGVKIFGKLCYTQSTELSEMFNFKATIGDPFLEHASIAEG